MINWLNRFDTPLPEHSSLIMVKFPNKEIRAGMWEPKTETTDLGDNHIGNFVSKVGDLNKPFSVWTDSDETWTEYILPQ